MEYLLGRIGIQEHVNFRQAFYNHRIHCPGITPASFKLLVNDIAITCSLHPSSLSVDADETGKIYLSSRIRLRICRIENVFTKAQIEKSLVSDESIPSRVVDVV